MNKINFPKGLIGRMLKVAGSAYFAAFVNLFVLAISIKYFPPEVVGTVAFITLTRLIYLSCMSIAGYDALSQRLNSSDQLKMLQEIRANTGIMCISAGLIGGLSAYALNLSEISIYLSIFYFIFGVIDFSMRRLWLLLSDKAWYLPLINVASNISFLVVIILFAPYASNLVDTMIFAATISSFVCCIILSISVPIYLPKLSIKYFKLHKTNFDLFINRILSSILNGFPTILGNSGYSSVSLTDAGFSVRSRNIARSAINPLTKSNSIIFGKALAQSYENKIQRFLILIKTLLALIFIFICFFFLIQYLLPIALNYIGADEWMGLEKIFSYLFLYQSLQGIYRFVTRTSWADISFVKIGNVLNLMSVSTVILIISIFSINIEELILLMALTRLAHLLVVLYLLARNDS